jgi:foldase protein PrsA
MDMMKDKLKGLLVGLALGTMMTGTLTYATTSTDIGVYFRELKYMFDGVEKQPAAEQQGFIYNDTTYVPLRFVAETLGKEVGFDNDTGTIWIGKNYGGEGLTTVAAYKGGVITKVELDTYIGAIIFYNSQAAGSINNPSFRQEMLNQLIGFKVLAARADEAGVAEAETAVANTFAQVIQYFGSPEALGSALKPLNLTDRDLKQYILLRTLANQSILKQIEPAALQAEYDRQRKADSAAFVTATVRHILISTSDPNGQPLRTEEEALTKAKSLQEQLKKGASFDELAKANSDDEGSKNNGGRYTNADITGYVAAFKKAAAELPLNQLSEPVKTEFGYHLIEVEARTVQTFDQVKAQLSQALVNPTYNQFFSQEVPLLIEWNSLTAPAEQP